MGPIQEFIYCAVIVWTVSAGLTVPLAIKSESWRRDLKRAGVLLGAPWAVYWIGFEILPPLVKSMKFTKKFTDAMWSESGMVVGYGLLAVMAWQLGRQIAAGKQDWPAKLGAAIYVAFVTFILSVFANMAFINEAKEQSGTLAGLWLGTWIAGCCGALGEWRAD